MQPINIDMYLDLSDPYCYLGKKRLENAKNKLDVMLNITFHPYINDLNIPSTGVPLKEYYKNAPGGKSWIETLQKDSFKDGLKFRKWKIYNNTFNAQRLVMYVQSKGSSITNTLVDILFYKIFEEGCNISYMEELNEIAKQCGVSDITAFIVSDKLKQEVLDEDNRAKTNPSINEIPYFIVEGKYIIDGAENPSIFLETLSKVIEERKQSTA